MCPNFEKAMNMWNETMLLSLERIFAKKKKSFRVEEFFYELEVE